MPPGSNDMPAGSRTADKTAGQATAQWAAGSAQQGAHHHLVPLPLQPAQVLLNHCQLGQQALHGSSLGSSLRLTRFRLLCSSLGSLLQPLLSCRQLLLLRCQLLLHLHHLLQQRSLLLGMCCCLLLQLLLPGSQRLLLRPAGLLHNL
jgi:hypothetical protein